MAKAKTLKFLATFLRKPAQVGAIVPSSRALARAMTRGIELAKGECILEFGPGTGPFTREIAKLLPDASAYLGIERDTGFAKSLREQFPDLNFVLGSAAAAKEILEEQRPGKVKAIISGLPFASLPLAVHDDIMASLSSLLVSGVLFRTFQYVHAYPLSKAVAFRKRMAEAFGPHTRSAPVLWNLPPAYVLSWSR